MNKIGTILLDKIGSEDVLVKIVAGLVREGLTFEVEVKGNGYYIILTGGH